MLKSLDSSFLYSITFYLPCLKKLGHAESTSEIFCICLLLCYFQSNEIDSWAFLRLNMWTSQFDSTAFLSDLSAPSLQWHSHMSGSTDPVVSSVPAGAWLGGSALLPAVFSCGNLSWALGHSSQVQVTILSSFLCPFPRHFPARCNVPAQDLSSALAVCWAVQVGWVPQQTVGPRGLCRMGVLLPGLRLHSSCFLQSAMHANGPEHTGQQTNGYWDWRLSALAFWLRESQGMPYSCSGVCRSRCSSKQNLQRPCSYPLVYHVDRC